MTLLAIDGLAYLTSATVTQRYSHAVSSPKTIATDGIFNSVSRNGAWDLDGSPDEAGLLTSNTDPTFIWQGYFSKLGGQAFAAAKNLRFQNTSEAVEHVGLFFFPDGSVEARNGDGTVLGTKSAPGSFTAATKWNFIECKVLINDTTGTVDLKINGQVILAITSADTRNGGTNSWVDMIIYDCVDSNDIRICNMVMMNSSGSDFNDFLGPRRIYTLFPNASPTANWIRSSTTSTNWELVDETSPDGDTTFVESLSTGDIDMYGFVNLSTTATSVDAIAVNISARESTSLATRNMRVRIDSTGNVATGPTIALSTSYAIYQNVFETDPNGSIPWTVGAVNVILAGIEVIA